MKRNFILKGNICWCETPKRFRIINNGYLVCENGLCAGVFFDIPERFRTFTVEDYTDRLIIPGLVDLHVHAPQYPFRGLGMDMELLEWLNKNAFVEEARYADLAYAEKAYEIFADDLLQSFTTRVSVFATLHTEATLLLMEKLEKTGICGYAGKVNMDRNSPDTLREKDAQTAIAETEEWIRRSLRRENSSSQKEQETAWTEAGDTGRNILPILTPRFVPSCTDELMKGLGDLQKKYHLPVQSHLSENLGEIAWVKELRPDSAFYGEAYARDGLFGGEVPTIMAHCIYSSPEERSLMKARGVFIAHCPESNMNVSSGIAPVRQEMEEGLKIGLGSDVAGGSSLSLFRAMREAIQCSKLRWRVMDQAYVPLTAPEAFYLATKGGGEFFGKVGSFEKDYEFDALVLDDAFYRHPQELNTEERLERLIYIGDGRMLQAKFVRGKKIFCRNQSQR